jgi:hypothetical protein
MEQELIAILVGAFVSVLLEMVPYLKQVWDKAPWKPVVLVALFLVVPVGAWALTCYAGLDITTGWACTLQGALTALWTGFLALLGNQGMFALGTHRLPQPRERARRERHVG